jgi:hypothetical protein
MVIGAGGNVTVSAGVDGLLLVDAGSAAMAEKVLEKVTEIGHAVAGSPARMMACVGSPCYAPGSSGPFTPYGFASPSYNAIIGSPGPLKPIRWIIETTLDPAHTGGTPRIATAGKTFIGGEAGRRVGENQPATVIGHEN